MSFPVSVSMVIENLMNVKEIWKNLRSVLSRIRVRTGPGNPGKSWNFRKSFSRPGKSWNSDAGPGKSWKSELGYIFLVR